MSESPTVTTKIDRFIAQNTFGSYPDEYGDVMRTRDALNVALAKLEVSESRADKAEEEIEQLNRAAMADEYPAAHQRDIIILRERAEAAEARAARLEAELKSAREAADIDDGMPLDEWITSARNDHVVMTNDRNVTQAELDDTIKQRQFWFAKFNEIASEREMYKQGFDALTAANEQIVKGRDKARRALAQHVTTRAELLDTIEKLKRENEAQAKRIKELEDSDAHFSRAMSEALNEGDGAYRP